MLPKEIKINIKKDDINVSKMRRSLFFQPKFNPSSYYKKIHFSRYYYALIILRHYIKAVSEYYFSSIGAKNIDLFMLTNSVSSPIGPGSDSEPINIDFGKSKIFLVDSSQFGFEPLLSEKLKKVYCYLPSMRGENPDYRHLNQFFHCEMEMLGKLNELTPLMENYVKILCETLLSMPHIINRISDNPTKTKIILSRTISQKEFPKICFDEAVKLLIKRRKKRLLNMGKHGRNITAKGEIELFKIFKKEIPIWLTEFDRDIVPFYQKPSRDKEKTINADLIFPPIIKGSFGGEIIGSGQRQNNTKEIYESLRRQKIKSRNYNWYINLRKFNDYKTTSGFGMGIERFIAWALAKRNIRDVALYPRLKNVRMYP